jgi:hypothetical protein
LYVNLDPTWFFYPYCYFFLKLQSNFYLLNTWFLWERSSTNLEFNGNVSKIWLKIVSSRIKLKFNQKICLKKNWLITWIQYLNYLDQNFKFDCNLKLLYYSITWDALTDIDISNLIINLTNNSDNSFCLYVFFLLNSLVVEIPPLRWINEMIKVRTPVPCLCLFYIYIFWYFEQIHKLIYRVLWDLN